MKHVFAFLAAMLLIASCGQPKFEFSLDANGVVSEATTNIHATFDVDVANVTPNYVATEFSTGDILTLTAPQAVDVNEWLDQFVTEKIINGEAAASYDISVKGYVKECSTGLKFEVDKTWRK